MKFNLLSIKNNFYIIFLAIFFIFYLIKIFEYQKIFLIHPWITGDWLINYSNGFIRRGFIGEMIARLSVIFDASILSLALSLKYAIYLTWILFFFLLAQRKRIGLLEITLILAPWAFLFDLHDPQGSGRKELLLVCTFTIFVYLLILEKQIKTIYRINWTFYYLIILLPLLTIIHEGLFFYFQFFLVALFFIKEDKKLLKTFGLPYLLSFTLLLLMYVFFKGDTSYSNTICEHLIRQNISKSICDGAIAAINPSGVYFTELYYSIYIPILALTIIPLLLYIKVCSYYSASRIIIITLLLWLPTAPLYFISFDWGRWIHIGGLLTLTTFIGLKDKFFHLNLKEFFFFPICIVYIFCWVIPHSIVGLESFKWFNLPLSEIKQLNFRSLWMFISF